MIIITNTNQMRTETNSQITSILYHLADQNGDRIIDQDGSVFTLKVASQPYVSDQEWQQS